MLEEEGIWILQGRKDGAEGLSEDVDDRWKESFFFFLFDHSEMGRWRSKLIGE